MVSYFLGAKSVVMADGDTDTLAAMRSNVAANVVAHGKTATLLMMMTKTSNFIACGQLRWGRNIERFVKMQGTFDVILASDVVYEQESLEPFLDTVVALLADSGLLWLSYA